MSNNRTAQPPVLLHPDWPAPASVRAVSTTRVGGFSDGPYAGFNLADHVGDALQKVAANRRQLLDAAKLPNSPAWLQQVHRDRVVDIGTAEPGAGAGAGAESASDAASYPAADGSVSSVAGRVCAVLTADCLPVLLCNRRGDRVAALHAGWRGLADGVLEAGVQAIGCPAEDLLAWLGPAIGPTCFEVGAEVLEAFVSADPSAERAFRPNGDRWLADLPRLARQRLGRVGVGLIYGGHWCTYLDADRFFSYRRDGRTGRQASLIWIAEDRPERI